MYKSVLVPVELGQPERTARMIAKARALLDKGGKITLLNVVESVQEYILAELPSDVFANRETQAMEGLRALADASGGGIAVSVRTGKPASEILAAAKEFHADLIIIASHNPGMQDFFIGSTAVRIVRHAHCSVLVDR
ncbi:MAG: universal stress protein [Phyllobacteriaceae bacterium]|nr:universal stress protein [Phyllobacteriaceae bacterium]